MKRHGFFFALSFITYPLVLTAVPYITAKTWADIICFFFVNAVIYQLLYVFFLRKSESISLPKAFALMFLYITFSMQLYSLYTYADIYINGFTPSSWLGGTTGETVYGFDAIACDDWTNIFLVPIIIICIIYQIVYFSVQKKSAEKKSADNDKNP